MYLHIKHVFKDFLYQKAYKKTHKSTSIFLRLYQGKHI